MSHDKMEWETANPDHLNGFGSFGNMTVNILAQIVALMLWMFFVLVVGTGWVTAIVLIPVLVIAGVIGGAYVKRLIL